MGRPKADIVREVAWILFLHGEVVQNQLNFADVIDGWVKARRGGPPTREQLRASCCHRTRMFWERGFAMEGGKGREMKGRGRSAISSP